MWSGARGGPQMRYDSTQESQWPAVKYSLFTINTAKWDLYCAIKAECWGLVLFLAPTHFPAMLSHFHIFFHGSHPALFALRFLSSFSPSLLYLSGELTLVRWVFKALGQLASVQPVGSSSGRQSWKKDKERIFLPSLLHPLTLIPISPTTSVVFKVQWHYHLTCPST